MRNQTEAQQAQSADQRTHLSESEMLDVLELARKTNIRDWAILVLAFHHGLRVTEVLELTLEGSINWEESKPFCLRQSASQDFREPRSTRPLPRMRCPKSTLRRIRMLVTKDNHGRIVGWRETYFGLR